MLGSCYVLYVTIINIIQLLQGVGSTQGIFLCQLHHSHSHPKEPSQALSCLRVYTRLSSADCEAFWKLNVHQNPFAQGLTRIRAHGGNNILSKTEDTPKLLMPRKRCLGQQAQMLAVGQPFARSRLATGPNPLFPSPCRQKKPTIWPTRNTKNQ